MKYKALVYNPNRTLRKQDLASFYENYIKILIKVNYSFS